MNIIIDAFLYQYDVLLILLLTSLACSCLGVFLVLRNLSMISDAISHSVLLGIVIAFLIVRDIDSPFLVLGATLFGILTTYSIEKLSSANIVKESDAVGIIFPLFFSLAVILISKFARNANLDLDMVLMGEIIMTPLNTLNIFGHEIPKAILQMSSLLFLNILFIVFLYKELKITTFDKEYAYLSGFSFSIIFYALMTLVSFTTVASFDVVGAILVISFLITPSSSAYLITKKLSHTIILSMLIGAFNSFIGFVIAVYFNVSISGMVALVAGITFTLIICLRPDGILRQYIKRRHLKDEVNLSLLLIHIGQHMNKNDEQHELGVNTIANHLAWQEHKLAKFINIAFKNKLIYKNKNTESYRLTDLGLEKYQDLCKTYFL